VASEPPGRFHQGVAVDAGLDTASVEVGCDVLGADQPVGAESADGRVHGLQAEGQQGVETGE
jgi:hypothetical protein